MKSISIFKSLPLLLVGLLGVSVCTLAACLGEQESSGISEDQVVGYGGSSGYGGHHGYGYGGSSGYGGCGYGYGGYYCH
jgi:hypothetical protein